MDLADFICHPNNCPICVMSWDDYKRKITLTCRVYDCPICHEQTEVSVYDDSRYRLKCVNGHESIVLRPKK